jgi:hypothetical protein
VSRLERCKFLPGESFLREVPDDRERVLDALATHCRDPRQHQTPGGGVQLAPDLYLAGRRSIEGGRDPDDLWLSLGGVAEMPLPFWSPKYDAGVDSVIDALSQDIDNDELGRISDIRADHISSTLSHRGHSQGIAVGQNRIITSVQEKRDFDHFSGHLQVYFAPVFDGDVADIEFKTGGHTPDRERWSHAVIGQGVIGRDVVDGDGVVHSDQIHMMCPFTNGSMGDIAEPPHDGAPTDLIDRDGNRLATYWHRRSGKFPNQALSNDRPELQTPALFAFRGRLYLIALRHQFLYVYRLHWFGGADADATVVWQRIVALDTSDEDQCKTVKPSGKRVEFPHYDAINMLLMDEGHVFLLGSHERWLDTWHVGVLNPPTKVNPGEKPLKPKLTKVAIMDQNWNEIKKNDLFGEACAIARMPGDERKTVGFWAMPHDYRHSNCDDKTGDPMCAHIYTWQREFG